MRKSPFEWLYADGYPLTRALIVLTSVLSLAMWFGAPLWPWLGFLAPESLVRPWTLVSYPLLVSDPIGLIFYGLILWWIGASLERSWGTRTYATFFAATAVISALSLALGAVLLKTGPVPVSYTLPLAALTVAWCALNPNMEIRLYGIIPILAKWLGVGTALIVFFTHARPNLLMGFFALAGCAASYYWIRVRGWRDAFSYAYRPPQPKQKRARRDDDFSIRDLNPIEKWKRAQRKKKFQRLFEDDDK